MNKFIFFLLSVLILFLTFHGGVFAGGTCAKCCLVQSAGSTCDGVHEGWGVCWSDCWLQGYDDCSSGCLCTEELNCNCYSCSPSFPCYCTVATSPTPGATPTSTPPPEATPTPPPTDWGKWFELGIFLFEDLNQNGVWDSNEKLIDPTNSQLSSYCGRHQITFVKSIGPVNIQLDCYPQEGNLQGCDYNTYQLDQTDCWVFDTTIGNECDRFTNAWNFWNPAVRCGGDDDFGGTIPDYWTCPTTWGICNCDCGQSQIVREWGLKFCDKDCKWVTPAFSWVTVHDRAPSDNRQVHKLRISPPYGWAISPGSLSKLSNGPNGSVGGILDPDGFRNPCFPGTCFYVRAIGLVPENFPPEVVSLSGDTQAYLGEEKQFSAVFKDASRFVNNNLVKNDSFEYGNSPWWTWPSSDGFGVVNEGKFGNKSFQVATKQTQWGNLGSVVQTITSGFSPGDQMTASFWYKTGEGITDVWLKVNYTANGVRNSWWNPVRGDPSPSWKRLVKTFTVPENTTSLEVEFQAKGTDQNKNAWVDGVLLEQGTTQGIYTDIKSFQFNLEDEDDANYSGERWPIRIHFDKNRSGYPRDSYQVAVGGSGFWTPAGIAFDANTQRWYLLQDVDIKDQNNYVYATLLGGADNTYFFLGGSNGQELYAFWKIKFKGGFNLRGGTSRNLNKTLYVNDLAGAEDEIAENNNLLEINGGPLPDNKWDFHRMGQINVASPQIQGKVWLNEVSLLCGQGSLQSGRGVSISSASTNSDCPSVSCQVITDSSGSYNSSGCNLLIGCPYTVSLTHNGDETCSSGFSNCPNTECSKMLTLTWDTLSQGVDFTVFVIRPPWFQTKEGSVYAAQAISSRIPSTCISPCLPYFSLKGDNNNGVISWGGGSTPSFGAGTAGEVNNWLANSLARRGYYEYFYRLLGSPTADNFNGNLSDIGADGVYYSSADDVTINNDWNFPSGRKAAVLIAGKLTVNKKIVVPVGSFLAFIVKNGIDINKDLGGASSPIEGVFITDGTFNSSAGGAGNTQLIVKGAVIAGEFSLGRDLGLPNKNTPAELFVYRSDFWLNSFPGLWGASHIWEELPP